MSAFGDAAAVTPEINHTLMSTGDLGASLVMAAAGYESVADMLMAELTAMGLNTSTTAMVGWQGAGGVMMQMNAAEFMAVCAAASAWVRIGQVQAAEVATAHTMAVESMIPAEVCLTNRATQEGLVGSNFFGQNTPGIVALDAQYFGEFWVQNATARTGYGSVVSTAIGALAMPAPFSPTAANPAGAAAAVAQDAATQGASSAFQAGAKSMGQVAEAPVKDASAAPGGMMSQLGGQMGGMVGQVGSMFGQVTQVGQQLPQMLGQAPQMFSGMLGPLMQGGMGGGAPAGALSGAAGGMGGMPGLGGMTALAGGGGGGGGGLMGGPSSALSSTFVRPASSFSTPNSPTLPGGWQGGAEPGGAAQTRNAGMGGGGMYGAPPAMGHGGQSDTSETSTRTMQVTARPGANRGERERI
jgi:PPE-repeat protein